MPLLEQSIVKTITWFDLFDFPLTAWEVWKFLWMHTAAYAEVVDCLNSQTTSGSIASAEGFYFLPGRQDTVYTRKDRYVLAERKFKKLMRVATWLTWLPWIRMIAVCNTLGYSNAREDSDIDLFIITCPRCVWITRFFSVSFLKLFKLRPILTRTSGKPENRRDKIDASFFVDEDHVNLASLALSPDIYLVYWIQQLVPIYDTGNYYDAFISANNWVKEFTPHLQTYTPSYRRRIKPTSRTWRQFIIKTTTRLDERFYRWVELKIMPKNLKNIANTNSNVIISDHVLKFHDQDRRAYYKDMWTKKLVDR